MGNSSPAVVLPTVIPVALFVSTLYTRARVTLILRVRFECHPAHRVGILTRDKTSPRRLQRRPTQHGDRLDIAAIRVLCHANRYPGRRPGTGPSGRSRRASGRLTARWLTATARRCRRHPAPAHVRPDVTAVPVRDFRQEGKQPESRARYRWTREGLRDVLPGSVPGIGDPRPAHWLNTPDQGLIPPGSAGNHVIAEGSNTMGLPRRPLQAICFVHPRQALTGADGKPSPSPAACPITYRYRSSSGSLSSTPT